MATSLGLEEALLREGTSSHRPSLEDLMAGLNEDHQRKLKKAAAERQHDFFDKEFFQDLKDMHRKEEEVQMAEMEGRLRHMIVDVLKPTVHRSTRLQTEYDVLVHRYEAMRFKLQEIMDAIKESKARTDSIAIFQQQLEKFWVVHHDLEARLAKFEKDTCGRIEDFAREFDTQKSQIFRLGRTVDNALAEMADYKKSIRDLHSSLEADIVRNKDLMFDEVRRVDNDIKDVVETHKSFMEEVWGPEDCEEISPVSLRRLDLQMRKAGGLLSEAMNDIADLRRLDGDVVTVKQQQFAAEEQLQALISMATKLDQRVDKVSQDTQQDMKRVSNLMAAFSANLMKETRANNAEDFKQAQKFREELQDYVKQSQDRLAQLQGALKCNGQQVEAVLKEIRIDVESLDERRKRDKQGLEHEIQALGGRVDSALDTSEATLRGLEHVSGIVSMSLQSQRMSVALDLQDFVDRKETPYVGLNDRDAAHVKPRAYMRSSDSMRKPGIAPEQLVRLSYKPKPLCFVGTAFERAQLLALREKVVHAAQEALQEGPIASRGKDGGAGPSRPTRILVGAGKDAGGGELEADAWCNPTKPPPAPIVGSSLGPAADFSAAVGPVTLPGRRPSPSSVVARPGSRGQPGARGSPTLEVDRRFGTPGDDVSLINSSPGSAAIASGKTPVSGEAGRGTAWGMSTASTSASPGMLLPRLEPHDANQRQRSTPVAGSNGGGDSVLGGGASVFSPLSAR